MEPVGGNFDFLLHDPRITFQADYSIKWTPWDNQFGEPEFTLEAYPDIPVEYGADLSLSSVDPDIRSRRVGGPKARAINLQFKNESGNALQKRIEAGIDTHETISVCVSGTNAQGIKPEFKASYEALKERNMELLRAHEKRMKPYWEAYEILYAKVRELGGRLWGHIPEPYPEHIPDEWRVYWTHLQICYLEGESFDQFLLQHNLGHKC